MMSLIRMNALTPKQWEVLIATINAACPQNAG